MAGADKVPDMPESGRLSYLIPIWSDLGRAGSNGYGPIPLPFTEIEAYARLERLTPLEARLIRKMSSAYVSGFARGKDVFGIAPWEDADGD